jgi:N-acetylglucosamine-6-phosphate deacetylase
MRAPGRFAVAASWVFDGSVVRERHAVIVEGQHVVGVVPQNEVPQDLPVDVQEEGVWLAPGFIDVQVNGGGDVLFNNEPSPEALQTIAAAHRRFGTTSLLPTFITDKPGRIAQAIEAVQAIIGEHRGILGIHLEGPFLSPERPGVHDPSCIRRPSQADLDVLTGLRGGKTLVTLAPECAPPGFVRKLVERGAVVALGHSMATYDQTRQAMGEGLTGFTHLFNAMRPLASREPGPIAAALESADCFYGLIADGEHVHPAMLKLALRGEGRPMLVTDAMASVGGTRPVFELYGETIHIENGRCLRSDGTLAGAALDMASAVRNCIGLLGLALPDALAMASRAPADFLGLGDRLGRLAPGCRADLIALEPQEVRVLATWLGGRRERSVA